MLYSPWLSEIRHHTQLCQFDMCKVGELKCPQTGMYMRKSMGVMTTNPSLYKFLHGKYAIGNMIIKPLRAASQDPTA